MKKKEILESKTAQNDSFNTMKRWLENRNKGKTFVDYFHECGYYKIAIYGVGDMGRLLHDEIKESDIRILYFVDRNAEGISEYDGISVVMVQEIPQMPEVDILVVSPIMYYDSVCEALAVVSPEMRTIALKDAVLEF